MNKTKRSATLAPAVGAQVERGVRPAAAEAELSAAIASAWRRHAQRVHYKWPMGCGGHAALQTPEIMAEQGFLQAAREVASLVASIERERARALVEAVRDANAAASFGGDSFHLSTEAQRVAWGRLMDVLNGPNVNSTAQPAV